MLSKVRLPVTVTKCRVEQGCQNASLKEGPSSSQKKTGNSGRSPALHFGWLGVICFLNSGILRALAQETESSHEGQVLPGPN